jgi:2-iminobutanoate/2-iminopropanoate deaminase
MGKVVIEPEELARPIGPFSSAIMKGNFVFVSGTVGRDRILLEKAGATMDDVVKVTVFLKDVKDYQGMNEVRAEFFPKDPPASSAVAIKDFMLPGLLVEIEAIAMKD